MERIRLRHRFFKTPVFKKQIEALSAWEQVDDLKKELDSNPLTGDVIPTGDGIRKIRMSLPGRGKRGGARVIYYYILEDQSVAFLSVYAKNEKATLHPDEVKTLIRQRDITVAFIKQELEK